MRDTGWGGMIVANSKFEEQFYGGHPERSLFSGGAKSQKSDNAVRPTLVIESASFYLTSRRTFVSVSEVSL
jgi:hypothetical protein